MDILSLGLSDLVALLEHTGVDLYDSSFGHPHILDTHKVEYGFALIIQHLIYLDRIEEAAFVHVLVDEIQKYCVVASDSSCKHFVELEKENKFFDYCLLSQQIIVALCHDYDVIVFEIVAPKCFFHEIKLHIRVYLT